MNHSGILNSDYGQAITRTPLREKSLSNVQKKRGNSRTFGFDLRDPLKVAQYTAEKKSKTSLINSNEQNLIDKSNNFKTVQFVEESPIIFDGDNCLNESNIIKDNSNLTWSVPSQPNDRNPLREKTLQFRSAQKKGMAPRTFGFDLRDPLKVAQYTAEKKSKTSLINSNEQNLIDKSNNFKTVQFVEESPIIFGGDETTHK